MESYSSEELLFGEKRAARGVKRGGESINRDAGGLFLQRRSVGRRNGVGDLQKKYVSRSFSSNVQFRTILSRDVFLND